MTNDLICRACRTPAVAGDRYCASCGKVLGVDPAHTWPTAAPVVQSPATASDAGFVPLNLPPEPEDEARPGRTWFSHLLPPRSRTA